MEHLLEGIPFLENIPLLRGYIFGVVHAGLIILDITLGGALTEF